MFVCFHILTDFRKCLTHLRSSLKCQPSPPPNPRGLGGLGGLEETADISDLLRRLRGNLLNCHNVFLLHIRSYTSLLNEYPKPPQ